MLSESKEMKRETLMAKFCKCGDNYKGSRWVSRVVFLEKVVLNCHEDLGERHIEMMLSTFQLCIQVNRICFWYQLLAVAMIIS